MEAFETARGKEKLDAASFFCGQIVLLDSGRRRQLLRYLRLQRQRHAPRGFKELSPEWKTATVALAYLDDREAEIDLLKLLQEENKPPKKPQQQLNPWAGGFKLGGLYLMVRGSPAHLVRLLRT